MGLADKLQSWLHNVDTLVGEFQEGELARYYTEFSQISTWYEGFRYSGIQIQNKIFCLHKTLKAVISVSDSVKQFNLTLGLPYVHHM